MEEQKCPSCDGPLVNPETDLAAMRCVPCRMYFTHTALATKGYTKIGLEREGWDTPPEAA